MIDASSNLNLILPLPSFNIPMASFTFRMVIIALSMVISHYARAVIR